MSMGSRGRFDVGVLAALWAILPAALVAAAGAGGGDEVVARWTFDTAADADAWNAANHCEKLGVKGGALQLRLTGIDAFVIAPPVRAPLDGCAVRIRMRTNNGNTTQLYWSTDRQPGFAEARMIWCHTPSTVDFRTYDLVLPTMPGAGDHMTAFRIDPCNGITDGLVEIDSVEVVRLAPVFEVAFHATDAVVRRETVTLRLSVRQTGGRAAGGDCTAVIGGGPALSRRLAGVGQEWIEEAPARADLPGYHRFAAKVSAGGVTYELETGVSRLEDDGASRRALVAGERLRLDLIPDAGASDRSSAARLRLADGMGGWIEAGLVQPLMAMMARDGDIVRSRVVAFTIDDSTGMSGDLRAGEGDCSAAFRARIGHCGGLEFLDVRASVRARSRVELLKLASPTVLIGWPGAAVTDRYGLFPGLEFLEPGWESSSSRAVGEKFAKRWAPHPHKITVPLMAIEQKGVTVGVLWQPLEAWMPGEGRDRPAATFASPNFLHGQPNYLLELSVPGVGEHRDENRSYARAPLPVAAGEEVRLRSAIVAARDLPVAWFARIWYEILGTPEAPPAPHAPARMFDICAQNYGETVYWPEQKGWRHHMYLGEESRFIPEKAAVLLSHAARTGNDRWVRSTGIAGRTIVDVLGPLANRLDAVPPHVRGAIDSQRPDGTWAFRNSPEMIAQARKFSGGKYADLGEEGSTSLGTTVMPALSVLNHALITGDAACAKSGVRALEAMRRFRVPRGAQVWEVHQLIPDVRAAALAVEAYRFGYQLTGDARYLDEAHYWAWAGVPFHYAWKVPIDGMPAQIQVSRSKTDWSDRRMMPASEGYENPRRQVMPYATIPVFGTTFYVISWFGTVVQWCGLEWAYQVLDLLEFRPDPLLRRIAEGVVRSGEQQMLDRPPWVGLYPDVWDLGSNSAVGAYISAMLPLECLRALSEAPADTKIWSRVFDRPGGRMHVSGWGRPVKAGWKGKVLSVVVDFAPGQPNELLIVNADRPASVNVAGQAISEGEEEGRWQYRADRRAVALRFRSPAAATDLCVGW